MKLTVLSIATLLTLAACTGNAPIPSGAQQVHIYLDEGTLVLQPGVVRAGDVYLVLEDQAAISLIERRAGVYGSPEALSWEQIHQIEGGNLQDTSVSGLESTTCDSQQRAAARGMTGPCGNVMRVTVQSGMYLIVAGPPEDPGRPTVVLSVSP